MPKQNEKHRGTGVMLGKAGLGVFSAVALMLAHPGGAGAQVASEGASVAGSVPSVFLDCQGQLPCDRTHFRTEIQFVNWAQDRADADVHVIATSQMTGAGGRVITLDFIGLGEMAALTDRMTYTSSGTDVQNETLNGLTQTLQLGLMRYAIESGLGRQFDVRFTGAQNGQPTAGPGAAGRAVAPQNDPWNFWTFRVGLSGNMNLRETSTNIRINPNVSADRVTEDWKLGFGANMNFQRNSRELTGGREIRDDRDDWGLDGLIVRSVSGHMSAGLSFSGQNSVQGNRYARIEVAPAIEYNYFPYLEANRRQFTIQYEAGVQFSNYIEETIYRRTEETRPQHELQIRYNAREQWGNAGIGANYSQYLHDPSLYRAGFNGNVSYRITRGLDLNLNGNASWIKDEIHIPLTELSDEDILLGRTNLPSSYQYNGSIGISYRWGSAFTNIVNTRFGGGGGPGGGPGGGGGGGGNFN